MLLRASVVLANSEIEHATNILGKFIASPVLSLFLDELYDDDAAAAVTILGIFGFRFRTAAFGIRVCRDRRSAAATVAALLQESGFARGAVMRHRAGEPARATGSSGEIGTGFGPARFGVGVAMRTIDVRVRTPTTFATVQIPRCGERVMCNRKGNESEEKESYINLTVVIDYSVQPRGTSAASYTCKKRLQTHIYLHPVLTGQ